MVNLLKKIACAIGIGTILAAAPAIAQPVVRLPQSTTTAFQPGVYSPQTGAVGSAVGGAPQTVPGVAPTTVPSTLGTPAFDAYSSNPGAASAAPNLNTMPPQYGTPLPPGAAPPPGTVPPYPGTTGNVLGSPTTMAPQGQPYGAYPPGAVPGTAPPSLYPNGMNTNMNWGVPAMRLFTPRVRYTYVDGGKASDDLGINDFDFSLAAAIPNFLYSSQPLYVVPSFSLHLWAGPRPPTGDLPANAYSAFLDFGWSTDPAKPLSGEIGVRLGVFTDFNTFNTNSGRIMGQGLFRLQTTPTTAVRGGVVYIGRNDLKLLPALGLLWTPNAQTRFDIFFPRPKLSQRLTTLGNHDVWWYVSGEYGGGAWSVQRERGFSDRVDINDIRLILGAEWGQQALLQQGRRTGFFEIGWVTSREVVYVVTPWETSSLRDSFMLRIGWNY